MIRSSLPVELQTALEALYGHYEKTFDLWQQSGIQGPSVLHRGLQQHLHIEAGLRLHLRLSPGERRWLDHAGEWAAGAVPQLRRARQPACPPAHAADRQRAARIRAMRWTITSAAWPRTRSTASGARSSSAPATVSRPRTSPIRILLREVMNTVGKEGPAGRIDSLRGVGLHAHRRLGCQHRHPCAGRARLRHATSVRTGHWPSPASPVLRSQRRRPVQRRICRCAGHSLRLHAKPVVAPPQPPRETIQVKADPPRPRCARNPLSPRGGLSGRTAGGAAHGRIQ